MKELSLLLVFCLLSMVSAIAQNDKDFNFILVVDDAVWISYTNLKIEVKDNNGSLKHSISGLYYPGNFSFKKEDYEKLLAAKSDSMTLVVDYQEQGENKNKHYVFELPFSASWLDYYFLVMRVYNLEKNKYRGILEPMDKEKNYTYELDYPGGQMLRVRNKVRKK